MIKAIVFDCFGVLTADSWRAFCDSLSETVDVNAARDLNHQMDAGLLPRDDFAILVAQITGKTPQFVMDLISNESSKNTQLLSYIVNLKPKYKIGLLSNVSSNWIRDSFLTVEERALFDQMVFSFDVGMTKPNPRMFELVCERLGVGAEQAIMVDDVIHYCEAAIAVGMKAINYTEFNKFKTELESILAQT